jgi:hypothetical protein
MVVALLDLSIQFPSRSVIAVTGCGSLLMVNFVTVYFQLQTGMLGLCSERVEQTKSYKGF